MVDEAGRLQIPAHERNSQIDSAAALILPTRNRLSSLGQYHLRGLERRIPAVLSLAAGRGHRDLWMQRICKEVGWFLDLKSGSGSGRVTLKKGDKKRTSFLCLPSGPRIRVVRPASMHVSHRT